MNPGRWSKHDLAAGVLLVAFAGVVLLENQHRSPTSDEPAHIASGVAYVTTGNFRGNPEHPPLVKELAGLLVRWSGVPLPADPQVRNFLDGKFPEGEHPEARVGTLVLQSDPGRILFWARLPMVGLACLLGLCTYLLGSRLLGENAALAGLALLVMDPTIVGHSGLVTMDIPIAAFGTLTLLALHGYLRKPSTPWLIACGVSLGLAMAAKFSALFLLPCLGIILWVGSAEKLVGLAKPRELLMAAVKPSALKFLAILAIGLVVTQCLYLSVDPLRYYKDVRTMLSFHERDSPAFLMGELQRRFVSYFAFSYLRRSR